MNSTEESRPGEHATEEIRSETALDVNGFSEGNAVVDVRLARTVARRQWSL